MKNDKQQYALVTGGTSGIGYELAKLLAKDGYNLVIVARTQSDLQRVANEFTQQFGVQVDTVSIDLFNPENAFALYHQIESKNIKIDILVNDAGQGEYGEFLDTDIRKELNIIDLNISSLVVLTKLFVKDMVARGSGRILNLSSIASKTPGPWQSVYHGTKAFVQSFTEAIRSELKDSGVTVTSLLPGATDTNFFVKAGMENSKMVQETKLSDPAEVARDGYKALMSGDDMVVSGLKNKLQVGMANVTPDAKAADMMKKQQEPVSQDH
ncbi:SDR family NAD(P)-dependent oxidoreductase [Chryseosolibacter indicus]|uniref:SDR family oxidoreductase n=1 Tax=Chryseosolibacter indicus TaxID=2782351 RepID=A0ABS5VK83_9BACT|nr:SDR family oxidoreductase [Chryseosolibacter indicus]MBT1701796.1 SDR family oxidoreductase [Chryseosolibacter indicus]